MRRVGGLLLVIILLAAVGWVGWRRASVTVDPLAEVRAGVGSKSAGPKLAKLRRELIGNAEVHFLSARQARLEGRPDDALGHLDRAESLGWSRTRIERERVLVLASNDYPHARELLKNLLAESPDDAEVLVAMARGELKAGRQKLAIELAAKAIEISPGHADALGVRGAAWLEARRLDLAKADLQAAFDAGPDSLVYAPARLNLATCLLDLGEFSQSLDLFRAARVDEPDNLLALFGVGRAASYLGSLEEAETAFRDVLARRPGHLETLLSLAQVTEQRGDLTAALGYLEQAEQADPNRLATQARLAKLLAALGQPERASKHEARYRELDPTRKTSGAVPKAKESP
ncbi:tetratricopeptide repeat protein [Zavarzinella formosa]|uniref:tetratricopeptide repeat protein n=1 Tax=Zavarzinella formosa TaxID=360055 RepID=UPI000361DADE|nr:tetratricopeptide repeat protein [Zavarzinella formosa]